MSILTFQDHEIPEVLCHVVRSLSLKDIGLYKGDEHHFLTPTLDPKENDMRKIRAEYEKYTSLQDVNFATLVQFINRNTTTDPEVQAVYSIHIGTGDQSALKPLQHIELVEDATNSTIHLLYLESNRFLVLRTSRSTILAGDILQANSLPICVGEQERFTIIRNGKPFVPEKYACFDSSFQTKNIAQIKLFNSPDVYQIIDEEECYGGKMSKKKVREKNVIALIGAIKDVLKDVIKDENGLLPNREYFPSYSTLLSLAKSSGIDCYTLNLLIECSECLRLDNIKYETNDEDWYYELTEIDKLEIEKAKKIQDRADYTEKLNLFNSELKKIHTRRVMFFFKAAGRISDMKYITGMERDLDAFAEKGFGTKGWAQQQRIDAIANSKPKPGENLITAGKLLAICIAIIFVGWIWFSSNRNMEIFNYKVQLADEILAQGKYTEARDAYRVAYEEYRPKITAMLAQSKMKKRMKSLEEALNQEIEEGIAQITAMRKADGGKFSEISENLMFRLLELAPNDSRLEELKNEWKNQY